MTAPRGGDAERTALKEWAVLVEAMGRGEIVAVVRKGGVRERRAGFSVRHDRFLLYPTFFHERPDELAPRFRAALAAAHAGQPAPGTVRLEYVGDVVGVWRAQSLEPLRAIEGEHGLAWPAVESRFRYRDEPGVRVVALRVARLAAPVTIPEERRYAGCVSWVELSRDVDVGAATPVLAAGALERRLTALRAALGEPELGAPAA